MLHPAERIGGVRHQADGLGPMRGLRIKDAMRKPVICALALVLLAGPSLAGAPQPEQTFDLKRLAGEWHELARTPNFRQHGCKATTTAWTVGASGQIDVVNTCIGKGGSARSVKARAVMVDAPKNSKVKMTFLGGLVSQEYWLLDRAADYRWLIMGTPGGNYVWIFTREAKPAAKLKAEAISHAGRLGYDTSNLVQDSR
jgi:apolipoprotein D and lipocalin family protein